MSEATTNIIEARNLRKTYRMGRVRVNVLKGVDLSVREGEWLCVLGASGSGKSTMLHLLGGLDRPDRAGADGGGPGSITYGGKDLRKISAGELNRYRNREVGFVFQFYHLLPELRVLENVTIGAMIRHGRFGYRGAAKREAIDSARELLTAFGLADRLRHRPTELSGGERQRVAIARALVNRPRILLADEPTGNLDRVTGESIIETLAETRERLGLTVVMVTHDERIAARAERVVRLRDGVLARDGFAGAATAGGA